MKNIKSSIALITLSCFIGQLLVGCNVGSDSKLKTIQNKATISKEQHITASTSSNDICSSTKCSRCTS